MKFRLTATVAVSAIMLGLGSPALADTAPAAASVAAPAPVTVPPLGFARRVLPNGLEVYSSRDTSTANVSIQVWYKVGGKDDPEGRAGFAHLFEHLMFKATRNLPAETFDRLTEDVGGSNNAFTSDDVTAYFEDVPANHLERLLFAEAERMGSLVVDEATFVAERDVVKEEYRQRVLSSPYGRLFSLFVPQAMFKESPYRRSVIGSIEELEASSIDDVRRFHATYYRPDAAYLIVTGNFDQAQLDGWIDQYFGPLKAPSTPVPVNNRIEPEPTGPREETFYAPNVPLPAVMLGWQTVKYDHPDRAALTVLDGILSTGESSRMYRSLVYDKQLSVQAGSSLDASQQAGYLTAYSIMAGGKTPEEGLAALNAEVARLRDEPVTAEELTEAKNEIVANTLRQRETPSNRAVALGFALINAGDATAADRELADIQAVTIADIQRVARRYLSPERQVTIRYLNADDSNPATPQSTFVEAPVKVSDLAPAGAEVSLAPEAERVALPQPGPEISPVTPQVADYRLDNGMRVLVVPRPGLPLVSARLAFDAGHAYQPRDKAGVASITASLLSQGTTDRSAPEIATEIEKLGASIGASAGSDFATVYANAPANVFPQTLALMAETVRSPALLQEELERLQSQTLDGMRLAMSQPASVARNVAGRLIFGDAPYGVPASGTLASVPGITREDVVAFHAAAYRPDQATLVFSGDITPAAALTLAQEAFGTWRAQAPEIRLAGNPGGEPVAPRVVVIDQPGAGQASVMIAARSLARGDEDYFPLMLGNSLLGGGFSARLSQEIRIKRGLSYGAGSGVGARAGAGQFVASAQTKNESAVEVADLLLQELNRMGTEAASNDELAPRRANMIGSYSDSLDTLDGLGEVVANLALFDLPLEELGAYAGRVRSVTPDQVRAAFAEHIPANRASLVIVGDSSLFLDALRAKHPNVEVIPLTDLKLDAATLR